MAEKSLSFDAIKRNAKAKSERSKHLRTLSSDFKIYEGEKARGVQTPDLVEMQEAQRKERSPHKFIIEEDDEDEDSEKESESESDSDVEQAKKQQEDDSPEVIVISEHPS